MDRFLFLNIREAETAGVNEFAVSRYGQGRGRDAWASTTLVISLIEAGEAAVVFTGDGTAARDV